MPIPWPPCTPAAARWSCRRCGTCSHPLADSRDEADHEGQTFQEVLGGVGLNLEDTVHSEGGRVRSTGEHADYLAGLRAAADTHGVPLWINGRTDLFLHTENPAEVVDEAIARLRAMVEAGASSVYPVRIQDSDELITAVVAAVGVPVNCTAHPVRHDLARSARLGVGRITYGPLLQAALTDAMTGMITPWRG